MMRYFIISVLGFVLLFTSALTKENRHFQAKTRRASHSTPQAAGFTGVLPDYRPGAR